METTEATFEHVREQYEAPADLTEAKFFQLVAYITRLEEGIINLAIERDAVIAKKGAEIERLRTELATLKAAASPATEAPAVDDGTIKVGDRVRVKSGMYEGETGTVTIASKGKSAIRMIPDNPAVAREFPLFKVERI